MTLQKKFYYGNEISEYGIKNGKVDYATLAKTFNHVLANDIISKTHGIGSWEVVSGSDYYYELDGEQYTPDEAAEKVEELENAIEELENEELEDTIKIDELHDMIDELDEPHYKEFYQFFIVDDIRTLEEAGETVLENEELGLCLWCVDHWGTSWDYVLTDIKITW